MALRPMANSVIGVTTATVAVAIIHNREAIPKPKKNKFSPLTKNALRCAAWSASSASRAKPSAPGLKKEDALPDLSPTLVELASHAAELELDELWSFVLKMICKCWIWIARFGHSR